MSTHSKKTATPLPDAYTMALRKKQESREFLERLTEKAEAERLREKEMAAKNDRSDSFAPALGVSPARLAAARAEFNRRVTFRLLTPVQREAEARGAALAGFLPTEWATSKVRAPQ
jgi:predicted TIM-barrel fold metal-dependent hydrolase